MKICDRCKKQVNTLNDIPGRRLEGDHPQTIRKVDICDACNAEYIAWHARLSAALFDATVEITYDARIDWLDNPEPYVIQRYILPRGAPAPQLTPAGQTLIERYKQKIKNLFGKEAIKNEL